MKTTLCLTTDFSTTAQPRLLVVMLLLVILITMFSSVATEAEAEAAEGVANNRYGGPVKRPVFNPGFSRPNTHFPSMLIPSPSHAYSIMARPPVHQVRPNQPLLPPRFQQQPQQHRPLQSQGIRLQGPPRPQLHQQQYNPVYSSNNYNTNPMSISHQPVLQQPHQQQFHYQQQQQQQQQPQTVYYPEVMTSSATHQQQVNYVPSANQYQTVYRPSQPQSVSYHQPTPQYVMHGSSSSNWLNYVPQQASPSNQQVHYHLHKQPLAAAASSPVATQQLISYEPCSSSGWSPILSSGSVVPAAAASSVQPNYFAASSVSTMTRPFGQTSFRYQPDSSNKVVVLSHDVLKTLLANSNKNNQLTKNTIGTSKGTVDTVATAASSSSSIIVNSNGNSIDKASGEPSVKLVGYIGPTSDNTPSGYIQVPVNKQILESLSGSNMNGYDMTANASQYSLFTMKSVNDVQSLLGAIKSSVPDQDTSASQTIPLGLVVSADGKPAKQDNAVSASNTMFYPSSGSTSSAGSNSPSIQMVGHVQVTSPDVSSQFTKREGQSEVAIASRSTADDKSDDELVQAAAPAPAETESKPDQ